MKMIPIQEIDLPKFEDEVLRCAQPVFVGFLADWSQPCARFEPVLEKVALACRGKARVLKVNVDDNPDLGTLYGIQSVPTLIYFIDGAVRAKIVGMASPKAILTKFQALTQANTAATEQERECHQ